jgi:hypothetical protein
VTGRPFGLVTGFINHLQVVTTITYYTIARLHNLQALHTSLLTLSAVVFTYSVSLNQTLQIKPSNHTVSLHATNFSWLSLKIISRSLKYLNSLKYTAGYSSVKTLRELPENCLGRLRCLQDNPSARTTEKTHLPHIVAKKLPSNCRRADYIENQLRDRYHCCVT